MWEISYFKTVPYTNDDFWMRFCLINRVSLQLRHYGLRGRTLVCDETESEESLQRFANLKVRRRF